MSGGKPGASSVGGMEPEAEYQFKNEKIEQLKYYFSNGDLQGSENIIHRWQFLFT